MTKRIIEIAHGLGIEVHDHIIVGRDGHASFKGLKLIEAAVDWSSYRPPVAIPYCDSTMSAVGLRTEVDRTLGDVC
jgi:hypothetical protein